MKLSRGLQVMALLLWTLPATAQTAAPGVALHGDPKYAADFTHFDYTNPDAPKGGELRLAAVGTYDTVNPFTLKGVAAAGSGMVFESLMESALDEPFSQYGLIAETVTIAPDRAWVSYKLRPEAKFSDGTPVTAEDVIFSFETLRDKGAPFYRTYYKDVVKAEKLGSGEVKFTFRTPGNTELPLIMGQLSVFSKAFWKDKDFSATTLEPIVGSGPYKISAAIPGRNITYKRNPAWWGKDLPVNRGRYNFDTIQYDYYRDRTVSLEAFFANRYDFQLENSAKDWATAYTSPAVKDGRIVKQEIRNELPAGMQGFIYNTRRDIFKDPRVREALNYAFDFEWSNKNVAFGAYKRSNSYFVNSELAATGLPSPEELAILEPYRGKIPDQVFATEYKNPATDGTGNNRDNLHKATELLRAAGWNLQGGKLFNAKNELFKFDLIDSSPMFERWVQPFLRNLERLGIQVNYRTVDAAQYQNLMDSFDFDMTISVFGQSLSPGNEQREFWSSASADQKGSRNLMGIKNPAIDDIVEKLIHAPDRQNLVTLCHALDRILLWNYYVIPHWYNGTYRLAYWNKFGQPAIAPKYGLGTTDTWWIDPAKQKQAAPK